jgi:predicted RNase H-like nuclease
MTTETCIGVDGCKAGWFTVYIFPDNTFEFHIHQTVQALWVRYPGPRTILIDIPIGLISRKGAGRVCDAAARKVLKPLRHSSVFSPPCREALAARTYEEACQINQKVCGCKISKQVWGISPKIKEVDDFLRSTPEAVGVLRETHPEICFWAMAGYRPMRHYKKSAEGAAERLKLLQKAWRRSTSLYKSAIGRYPAKQIAPDDIIDALANAVTALRLGGEAGVTLPEDPPADRLGLPVEMVYAPA